MLRPILVSALLLAPIAFFAAPASAFACSDPPTLEANGIYLDVRHVLDNEALWSVFLWAENGIHPGLQRGGVQVAFALTGTDFLAGEVGEVDHECHRSPASDFMLL